MTYNFTNIAASNTSIDAGMIARAFTLDEQIRKAESRSYHSFFDIHVIELDDGTYGIFEEGDYGVIPNYLIDSIVYTADGKLIDEY